MKEYYDLLGLQENATLAEIKSAYRRKAKETHPDKNKTPGSEQDFIAVTEAYRILIAHRSKAYGRLVRTSVNKTQTKEDFLKDQKARARKKAREYAAMKYGEFLKSEGYQTSEAFAVLIQHFLFLFCIVLVVGLPLMLYSLYGESGLGGSIFLLVMTSPLTLMVFREYRDLSLSALKTAVEYLFARLVVYYVILCALNLFLLCRIGFQTMIPTTLLIAMFILLPALFQLIKNKNEDPRMGAAYFRSVCIVPLILNLLLLINYLGSDDPVFETYRFTPYAEEVHDRRRWESRYQNTSLIILENETYKDYWGIRIFSDHNKVSSGNTVQYKIEKGLLGVRVMKDFGFREVFPQ